MEEPNCVYTVIVINSNDVHNAVANDRVIDFDVKEFI
jgi:hypothetical protein